MAKKFILDPNGKPYKDSVTGLPLVVDVPEGSNGDPIIATTGVEIEALMTAENVGKVVKYEGEDGAYLNGEIYKVMDNEDADNTQYYTYENKLPLLLGTQDATNKPYEITAEDLEGVTAIANYQFYRKDGLIKIDLSNVTGGIGGYAFNRCSNLADINMQNVAGSIGTYAFEMCDKLVEINAPNAKSIDSYAFTNCDKLLSADIQNATTIGSNAFYNSRALQEVNIQNATTIGSRAFTNCTALTTLNMQKVEKIEQSAFSYCSKLPSVIIPATCTSIGGSAFSNCSSLESVVIQDNCTSIGSSAFSGCDALESVIIPATCTSIGGSAFSKSYNGGGVYPAKCTYTFLGTTPPTISTNTFTASYINKIIVPKGCGETYKTATNWTTFADYIVEAEE